LERDNPLRVKTSSPATGEIRKKEKKVMPPTGTNKVLNAGKGREFPGFLSKNSTGQYWENHPTLKDV